VDPALGEWDAHDVPLREWRRIVLKHGEVGVVAAEESETEPRYSTHDALSTTALASARTSP
jgi:hypothetical protein